MASLNVYKIYTTYHDLLVNICINATFTNYIIVIL